MPSQKQDFTFPGQTTEQLLLTAYGAFLELGWTPKYAGPNAIIGYTPKRWNKYPDEILVEATDGSLTITSSLVHNESFDLMGKNKKHIRDFMAAFENVKAGGIKPEWSDMITSLRQQTISIANEETKKAEEADKIMKMSTGNRYVTYAIIAINFVVFIAMAVSGVSIFSPSGIDILKWGANYGPLTVSGDWWRLLSSMFVHIGIIHILFNMYALYMVGNYLEPMLGKIRYAVAYLCSGICGSIGSLIWHTDPVPSAGASGAIFGMYGVFLALLLTNLIPKQIRMPLLQSIGVFVVFNLVYGMQSGIDNAAHMGGLVSGMVIGFVYYLSLRKEESGNKKPVAALAIALVTIAVTWYYLDSASKTVPDTMRQQAQNELKEAGAKDGIKYFEMLDKFAELDRKNVAIINDTTATGDELLNNISKLVAEWDKALTIVQEMKKLELSDLSKQKIKLLEEYSLARKEEVSAYTAYLTDKKPENSMHLSETRDKINNILVQINELN